MLRTCTHMRIHTRSYTRMHARTHALSHTHTRSHTQTYTHTHKCTNTHTRRFYYDCLMRPNAKSVTTALRKVKDLPYTTIANGHGPILKWVVVNLHQLLMLMLVLLVNKMSRTSPPFNRGGVKMRVCCTQRASCP